MKFLVFVVTLGGAYAVFDTFLSQTPAAILSWPVAIAAVALYARWRSRRDFVRAMKSDDPDAIARATLRLDPEFAFMSDTELDMYTSQARRNTATTPVVADEPDDPSVADVKCPACGLRVSSSLANCPVCGDSLADAARG